MINWKMLRELVDKSDSIGSDPSIPRKVRELVIKRDGKCVVCGRKGKGLHVHHINPGRDSTLDNLVTLCRSCHQAVHCLLYSTGKHKFVNVIRGFK